MKKRIWKLHSWIGLFCALALTVIGLTGSVLVFHQEISDTLAPETTLNQNYSPDAQRLPVSQLTQTVESKFPNFWIRGWLFNHQSPHRDKAYVMERGGDEWHILYVDPYTGETAERPYGYNETLYGWFINLHYTFFADHVGMAIAGIFALGFLFLAITGIYLHRPFFKTLFKLRWGASARIFFSDLHKAVGIATIPMNLIFGITGAYWNISHVLHDLIEHAHEDEHAIAVEYPGRADKLDALASISDQSIPGYSLNYIYFPTEEDPTFYLYGQHPGAGVLNSPYGSSVWVKAESGEVTHSSDLSKAGFWAQVLDSFEPLHFGSFAGLGSQILWCLAGLSPAALSLTGTIMFFKRGRRKKKKRPLEETRPERAKALVS